MLAHVLANLPDIETPLNELPFYRRRNIFLADFQYQKYKIEKYEAMKLLNVNSKLKKHCYFLTKEQFLEVTKEAVLDNPGSESPKKEEQIEPVPKPETEEKKEEGESNPNENPESNVEKKFVFSPSEMLPFFKLDYVILNASFNYVDILQKLIPFMNSNCKIVIHDRFYKKINDAYNFLKNHENMIMVEVSDFLVRDYQVYNMRTHPTMRGPLNEAYYLTAYKVD